MWAGGFFLNVEVINNIINNTTEYNSYSLMFRYCGHNAKFKYTALPLSSSLLDCIEL